MNGADCIEWSEIEAAASKMFAVWSGGGELAWAKECWGYLTPLGLTLNTNPLDMTTSLLRLVALARIYEEFCGYAWDENPGSSAHTLAEDLEIDPVALGILAGQLPDQYFDEATDEYELREAALIAVTDSMRPELFANLVNAYGSENKLYSRMAKTNHDPDEEDDNDEFEVTGPNESAYNFVMSGFRK
jgi:hypothetical protein